MLRIKFMSTYKIAPGWMPQNSLDGKSTLVQVMARFHQPDPMLTQIYVTIKYIFFQVFLDASDHM